MTKRPERFIIATDGIKLQGRLYMDARAYMDRTWLEVDLDALERNVRKCRSIIGPNCALTAVVKSDAYGLGAIPVARALWAMGVDMLAVACLSEARVLRAALPGCADNDTGRHADQAHGRGGRNEPGVHGVDARAGVRRGELRPARARQDRHGISPAGL